MTANLPKILNYVDLIIFVLFTYDHYKIILQFKLKFFFINLCIYLSTINTKHFYQNVYNNIQNNLRGFFYTFKNLKLLIHKKC